MDTQCNEKPLEFQADFDGGHVSSDGGALLLREMDERLGLTQKLARCFVDHRENSGDTRKIPGTPY